MTQPERGLTCEDCGRVANACRIRNNRADYYCQKHYELLEVLGEAGDQWIVLRPESTTAPRA